MRSPHTTGLACERPGMGVFQTTFCDFVASQLTGVFWFSATPDAFTPRNCGQFCAPAVEVKQSSRQKERNLFIAEPASLRHRINFRRRRCVAPHAGFAVGVLNPALDQREHCSLWTPTFPIRRPRSKLTGN